MIAIRPYIYKALIKVLLCCFIVNHYVIAQTDNTSLSFPEQTVTVEAIQSELSTLVSGSTLSEAQLSEVEGAYNSALNEMNLAAQARQDASRFERELREAPTTESRLREEIKSLVGQLDIDPDEDGDQALNQLELRLSTLESELRTYRNEAKQLAETHDMLLTRPLNIRDEISSLTNAANNSLQQISELQSGEEGTPQLGRLRLAQAQNYRQQVQIIALERELSGLSARQELVGLRKSVMALKISQAEKRTLTLQSRTGQRRILLAQNVLNQAKADLSLLESGHAFVRDYAANNYAVATKLSEISERGGLYPRRLSDAQDSLEIATEDLRLANQLIELGNLNRASNTNLRRIQNKREPLSAITIEISKTKKEIADQMQARILAEDELRELRLSTNSISNLFEDWQVENMPVNVITDIDLGFLSSLNQRRQTYLSDLIDATTVNIDDANILLEVQLAWRTQVSSLQDSLNKTLLWTPSSDIVGASWPAQITRGATKLVSINRLSSVASHLMSGLWRYSPLMLVGILIVFAISVSRKRLFETLVDISKQVGRVQVDNYWHTPRAIALCGIITLPIPLIIGLTGFVLLRTQTPDPFILQLGQTGVDVAGFLWFFMTWHVWNQDNILMGPHFEASDSMRQSFNSALRWFIPLGAVLIGMVTVTQTSRDIDIYSGFSVFAFILVAITMAVFALRVFWSKIDGPGLAGREGHRVWKYRKSVTLIFVGLPILSAILAILGYYETARVLLSRLLFSSGLVVTTYVLYGLIRRTVLVAQRRLSLQQAIERRDRIQKARQEAAAAEERGEAVSKPAKVNYDEIDVETMSRQTAQLLNTLVTVGFAALMWLFWQDLLPALSVVDNIKLPLGETIGVSGEIINSSISLWTILKSITILALTIIAGKNLPGFLEVFVLDSFKLEAGTRYAIITVLGYVIFAIGLAIAFTVLGVKWAKLQWIVAALGVGIGFGLQEIIANFISGLIILFERPIRIGDYVTIGDQSGTVSRIKIRATTLTDLDNREILIPNKEIITGRVTNWTLSNSVTRLKLYVGIAYGSDTDHARDLMLSVLKDNEKILDRPNPQVFFLGFGESSLDFELRAFISNFDDRFPVLDKLHTDINKSLEIEGITIPFPQRDLHVVSESYPSSAAPKAKPQAKKKLKPKTS